jgi:hypothetical protein
MVMILFVLAAMITFQVIRGNEILSDIFTLRRQPNNPKIEKREISSFYIASKKDPVQRKKLNTLIEQINSSFDLRELSGLCLDLNVDIENLSGSKKIEKIIQLVEFHDRHRKIPDLIETIKNHRPKMKWENFE